MEEWDGGAVLLCLINDVLEEFAFDGVLHEDVEVLVVLDEFVELDDVGVAEDLEDLDLPGNAGYIAVVLNLLLVDDFDGDLLLGGHVDTLHHY